VYPHLGAWAALQKLIKSSWACRKSVKIRARLKNIYVLF
jgi:hypothetical protein